MFPGGIIRSASELTGTGEARFFLLFFNPFVALKILCKAFIEAFLEVSVVLVVSVL